MSRRGDFWLLDRHRLLCGDARDQESYSALLQGERADAVFTDPPYNVPVRGHVSGRGRVKHREFAVASGEMSEAEFTEFLKVTLGHAASVSREGAVHFVCADWRHVGEFLAAGRDCYGELLNIAVWAKTNFGLGAFYRSQHEFVLVYRVGSAPHLNNIEHRPDGRNRSNLWTYAGANTFRAGRLEDLATHPTVKPVALVADAIRDVTRRGEIVLDPFLGSGTTILAAERVGRRGYGLEIDPIYVDAAIRRWQKYTKRDAILKGTSQTFDKVADARASEKARRAK
jgi:DNA modification methylase